MKKRKWGFFEDHIEIICCPGFWFLVAAIIIVIALACSGCAWQGQRHPVLLNNDKVAYAEWWSMRWCWMSSGVELYDWTPYWQAGASMAGTRTDPEAVKATGSAVGTAAGAVVK
jgi:hypothetical protein